MTEPTTPAGRALLGSWRLVVDEYGPPNTVVIRDAILAIEAQSMTEAQSAPDALLREALYRIRDYKSPHIDRQLHGGDATVMQDIAAEALTPATPPASAERGWLDKTLQRHLWAITEDGCKCGWLGSYRDWKAHVEQEVAAALRAAEAR